MRLWDGRIGRWLTTDPYGQYHSPYMAMDNNPISSIDPTGGEADWHWEGGKLVSDPGDNAQTLATFLVANIGFANSIMEAEGFIFDNVLSDGTTLMGGQVSFGDYSKYNSPYILHQTFSYSNRDIGITIYEIDSPVGKLAYSKANAVVRKTNLGYTLTIDGFISTDNNPDNSYFGWLNVKYTNDKSSRLATIKKPFIRDLSTNIMYNSDEPYLGSAILILPRHAEDIKSLSFRIGVHSSNTGVGLRKDILSDIIRK